MKIAVLSDLHLGFSFGSEPDDSFANARQAFYLALKEKPDLILLAGDIFHDKIPKQEILGKAIEIFSELRKDFPNKIYISEKIKNGKHERAEQMSPAIACIWGTHERRQQDSTNPVQILEKAGFLCPLHAESILAEAGSEGKIGIHGLSGVPDKYAKEILKTWNPKPFPNVLNIFLIHQTFQEQIPQAKDNDMLSYADLPKGFDLFILGHIHLAGQEKHPAFKTPIIVPGSTILTQMSRKESEQQKGFFVVDTRIKTGEVKFVPIETRAFFYDTLKSDKNKPQEISIAVRKIAEEYLKKKFDRKPIVRIKIEGTLADGFSVSDLNVNSLAKEFSDKIILSIDKSGLSLQSAESQSKLLQELKEKKLSVEQIGLEILKQNLKINVDAKKLEMLFGLLAEGEIEKAEVEL